MHLLSYPSPTGCRLARRHSGAPAADADAQSRTENAAAAGRVVHSRRNVQRFQILPEERVLAEKFGTAFERYKCAVRRWL